MKTPATLAGIALSEILRLQVDHSASRTPHSAVKTFRTPHSVFPRSLLMPSSRIPHSAFRTPHSERPAFTLVEMLVVIAIIAMLAAILMPAIWSAVLKARNAAVISDISQLEMAIEEYKNQYGDYPPNFVEMAPTPFYGEARNAANPAAAWSQTVLARHLKRINRNAKPTLTLPNGNPDPLHPLLIPDPKDTSDYLLRDPPNGPMVSDPSSSVSHIDAAEALVLWLGGLSANAQYPLTGPGGPLSIDTVTGAFLHPSERRATAIFQFNETRLRDYDGDGLYEYYPPSGSGIPYAYFDSRSYDSPWSDFSMDQVPGSARPYTTQTATGLAYMQPGKFQILSAGLDENYGEYSVPAGNPGNPADRKSFPTGAPAPAGNVSAYTRQDFDNIGNFSEGVFEDKMP
jgi:prepilin-type N-terminal cleavage/methylation domain-containing protein